uniref:RING-type domain-containing protein n=1 Tax=viral metagenome TaxID=1070528 RepID=A0A6C0I310_9ZZZZ
MDQTYELSLEVLDSPKLVEIFTDRPYKKGFDKSHIESIHYRRITDSILIPKHIGSNHYIYSKDPTRRNLLFFYIQVQGVDEPFMLCCEDSRIADSDLLRSETGAYKGIDSVGSFMVDSGSLQIFRPERTMVQRDLDKEYANSVIANLGASSSSTNHISYMLRTLLRELGFYTNRHIVESEEKILHDLECPIAMTSYEELDSNVCLLFPCLHCVSKLAYDGMMASAGEHKCPLCMATIQSVQEIQVADVGRIYSTRDGDRHAGSAGSAGGGSAGSAEGGSKSLVGGGRRTKNKRANSRSLCGRRRQKKRKQTKRKSRNYSK